MESQLKRLKESVAKLEPEFGADNPHVQGLKAQIAMYEKPRAENPMQAYSVGMRPAPMSKSLMDREPLPVSKLEQGNS